MTVVSAMIDETTTKTTRPTITMRERERERDWETVPGSSGGICHTAGNALKPNDETDTPNDLHNVELYTFSERVTYIEQAGVRTTPLRRADGDWCNLRFHDPTSLANTKGNKTTKN